MSKTGFFIPVIMQLIFDDNQLHLKLAPLTLTKPVAELRFGILSNRESWVRLFEADEINCEVCYNTESYLSAKFKPAEEKGDRFTIYGNIKPSPTLFEQLSQLKDGELLIINEVKIGLRGGTIKSEKRLQTDEEIVKFEHVWELFQHNKAAISLDFNLITKGRISAELPNNNQVLNPGQIFIEPGAKINFSVLNANDGPIYIGKDAEIMEGALIRGPFALCDKATVKMGAKIYGATTIGPECKVGGEISNSIFQAFSNKGHDGFMGNSVIGEWCNFGADTNTSNLKNNYSNVKIYDFYEKGMILSDVLFCGTIMGDHSKTGINTMLNTATVVGVSANIFGGGFPSKFIPSFTWGGVENTDRFIIDKAFEVAKNMMARRGLELTTEDKAILTHLYNMA